MGVSTRIQPERGMLGSVEAHNTDPSTGALFMKSLSIIAALALGLSAQAATAQPTTQVSPGVSPTLAHKYVPKYDIVTAKVAQGVKFENPALAKGLNPQPEPPSQGIMKSLPSRNQ
jgi:hypothetical protein